MPSERARKSCESTLEFKDGPIACDRLPRHKGIHRGKYRYLLNGKEYADVIRWNSKGDWLERHS